MYQIKKTKEHNLFKIITGNRIVKTKKVKNLMEAVQKNNQLNLHPIIVNNKMEVIDGQHRLQVAKILGLDIYYILSNHVDVDHLVDSNVNQQQFTIDDFIEFFAVRHKKKEYIQFKEIMKITKLRPKATLSLISTTVSVQLLENVKKGVLNLGNQHDLQQLINLYTKFYDTVIYLKIKPLGAFTTNRFTKALRHIYLTPGFNAEIMIKKIEDRWFTLKPQSLAEDWYQLLINIYNYRNSRKIKPINHNENE